MRAASRTSPSVSGSPSPCPTRIWVLVGPAADLGAQVQRVRDHLDPFGQRRVLGVVEHQGPSDLLALAGPPGQQGERVAEVVVLRPAAEQHAHHRTSQASLPACGQIVAIPCLVGVL